MDVRVVRLLALAAALASLSAAGGQPAPAGHRLGGSWLHAHNCYPERGLWQDRLDRALGTRLPRLAIEQDVAWAPASGGRPGRSVVSHDAEIVGTEPTLEEHFFARVRPLMERALVEQRTDQWPILILHLDFKTNEPEHHRAVWEVLSRHRDWLTTAARAAGPAPVAPLRHGPLLVLTENGPGQEAAFYDRVPIGDHLLVFGTTPSPVLPPSDDAETRARVSATAAPASLVPWPATNYRRWTNFSWNVVELRGQAQAADWTAAEAARLEAIVQRAHGRGLWVRFYTLNGHDPLAGRGWSASYNFGSEAAVRERWQAAIAAGVDFVATDQYEEFARLLR